MPKTSSWIKNVPELELSGDKVFCKACAKIKLYLPSPIIAANETIEKAKNVVDEISTGGLTNMIGGLETALYLVKVGQNNQADKKHQPIIIFLTDGEPNVGISSTEEIVRIVTRLNSNGNNVPIYSLSFGYGANKEFLRKLSLKNQGFSRHIYEASDASLQLQEFYKQISSPLLSNIKFKYNSEVKDVTKSSFPILFRGSELVSLDSNSPFEVATNCWAAPGPKKLTSRIERPVSSLERLWAYLTVKQTLEERDLADNKSELTKKALDLALKYSFVTDITSLVVVKPNDTRAVDTEEAATG
ncbi:hypothetical protein NQ314_003548 [Rhamnusium bicolor]|uniref:VWFA domain-containing protein n=1 Tax=Rhamnusium bicolor TaxID=1586634 RepID=A0AAV8ZLY7_9CUCU|nr:hypothetical protein NQ314_003548 [Rhamnusium bicolor]